MSATMSATRSAPWAPSVLALLALVVAVACATPARAAEAPPGSKPATAEGLTALVSTRLLFPRPRAPLPITITIASDDPTPQPGTATLTVSEGQQALFTWTGPEWAVARTPRTVEVLLPPLPIDEDHEDLTVQLAWHGGGRTVRFEPMPLGNTGRGERPLTAALCTTAGVDARTALRIVALDRFLALEAGDGRKPGDPEAERADARVVPVRLGEADLPTTAAAWCAYDLAVISGDALARLKARQLAALEAWVRGGGSALLLPEGQLGEDAMAFLRRLGADDGWRPAGDRVAEDGPWPLLLRPGIGRAAVAPGAFAIDAANEAAMRQAPVHLWRLRAEQAVRMLAGHRVNATAATKLDQDAREEINQSRYYGGQKAERDGERLPSLTHVPLPLGPALTNLLMPSRVSVIPFGVVCAVFLAFVLVVGPGDWFVLGWLRARRFTWVVFPLVAIAFTVLMVRLSRHYLGVADHRQRLEIGDVGAAGAVARSNTIELVFVGERAEVGSELSDALWTDLGRGELNRYRYGQPDGDERVDAPAAYAGTVPGRYAVTQAIGQWDPRLRRSLAFAAPEGLPFTLDRDRLPPDQAQGYADELAERHAALGPLFVGYWRQGSLTTLHGRAEALSERTAPSWDQPRDWLAMLSVHPAAGWFSLAASIPPAGGRGYEDLPLHDPTDADELLLVAAQRRGDRVWVLRRLYRLSEGATR